MRLGGRPSVLGIRPPHCFEPPPATPFERRLPSTIRPPGCLGLDRTLAGPIWSALAYSHPSPSHNRPAPCPPRLHHRLMSSSPHTTATMGFLGEKTNTHKERGAWPPPGPTTAPATPSSSSTTTCHPLCPWKGGKERGAYRGRGSWRVWRKERW